MQLSSRLCVGGLGCDHGIKVTEMDATVPVSDLRPPFSGTFVETDTFDATGDVCHRRSVHVFLVLLPRHQSQVDNSVVLTIAVDVVNFSSNRNTTVNVLPDGSV